MPRGRKPDLQQREEMCAAVEEWLRARNADTAVEAALQRLPVIDFMG
jgi:hypothetical protein